MSWFSNLFVSKQDEFEKNIKEADKEEQLKIVKKLEEVFKIKINFEYSRNPYSSVYLGDKRFILKDDKLRILYYCRRCQQWIINSNEINNYKDLIKYRDDKPKHKCHIYLHR